MLETGTKAPDFELPDQNGNMHKLSDYAGKKVILYFYPKDNTAGCTKQACGFSERYPLFTEKGAVILGVNRSPSSRQLKKYKFFLPAEIYLLAVFMRLASKFRVFPLVLKFRDSFVSVYCYSNLYNLRSFLREYLYQ